jgi:hypothetical protein
MDAYLQAIANAGPRGFTPVGQLYMGILYGYVERGLMSFDGCAFRLTNEGRAELERFENERIEGVSTER